MKVKSIENSSPALVHALSHKGLSSRAPWDGVLRCYGRSRDSERVVHVKGACVRVQHGGASDLLPRWPLAQMHSESPAGVDGW